MTHSYTNGPILDQNYLIFSHFLKFGPILAQILVNFEKLTHSYTIFCIKKGLLYTRRLILPPMLVAHPQRVFVLSTPLPGMNFTVLVLSGYIYIWGDVFMLLFTEVCNSLGMEPCKCLIAGTSFRSRDNLPVDNHDKGKTCLSLRVNIDWKDHFSFKYLQCVPFWVGRGWNVHNSGRSLCVA